MTHICVSKLTIIGSDNGRRQAIIWTNAGILLIRILGTNFGEILSKIPTFSFKKMHLKMSSAKWRPFCLGLNVLTYGARQIQRWEPGLGASRVSQFLRYRFPRTYKCSFIDLFLGQCEDYHKLNNISSKENKRILRNLYHTLCCDKSA